MQDPRTLFIVAWHAGLLTPVLAQAYRDAADLVLLESYFSGGRTPWKIRMGVNLAAARSFGISGKCLFALGINDADEDVVAGRERPWVNSVPELEEQMRWIRLLDASETPGFAFFAPRASPVMLAAADRLLQNYSVICGGRPMNPVNAASMTRDARRGGYAIGAFNLLDFPTMRGIVEGAQRSRAPVIFQASVRTVEYWSPAVLAGWYLLPPRDTDFPVALHLDHCPQLALIRNCIDEGWTSVMIDASSLPLEANIAATAAVVELARPVGVSVEAELGSIGGSEDGLGAVAQPSLASGLRPVHRSRGCRHFRAGSWYLAWTVSRRAGN